MVLESGWCLWGATQVDRVGRFPNPDDPCMDYLLTLGAKWLHSIGYVGKYSHHGAFGQLKPNTGYTPKRQYEKGWHVYRGVHVLEWVASVCPSCFFWWNIPDERSFVVVFVFLVYGVRYAFKGCSSIFFNVLTWLLFPINVIVVYHHSIHWKITQTHLAFTYANNHDEPR